MADLQRVKAFSDFCSYLAQAHRCDSVKFVRLGSGSPAYLDRAEVSRAQLVSALIQTDDASAASHQIAKIAPLVEASRAAVVCIEGLPVENGLVVLREILARSLPNVAFTGQFPACSRSAGAYVAIADHLRPLPASLNGAPENFRVLAIMPTYNEEDVIAQTIEDLVAQGVDVYLLDNWSTDRTIERARRYAGAGLISIERFPPQGPASTYNLESLLLRVEQIALEHPWANWVMLHDADERRRSPWPNVRLREAFSHVDHCGFNCVDHVTMNFWPVTDSEFSSTVDLEQHFTFFEFSTHPGHFHQRRAWKQNGQRVGLAATAGHDVTFAGRRVYPYKFLLKHYPIRSQSQGDRKVFRDRVARWNRKERQRGWHRQYDHAAINFVRDPGTLTRFDPLGFNDRFLVERLSGAGIFSAPPSWATPPAW